MFYDFRDDDSMTMRLHTMEFDNENSFPRMYNGAYAYKYGLTGVATNVSKSIGLIGGAETSGGVKPNESTPPDLLKRPEPAMSTREIGIAQDNISFNVSQSIGEMTGYSSKRFMRTLFTPMKLFSTVNVAQALIKNLNFKAVKSLKPIEFIKSIFTRTDKSLLDESSPETEIEKTYQNKNSRYPFLFLQPTDALSFMYDEETNDELDESILTKIKTELKKYKNKPGLVEIQSIKLKDAFKLATIYKDILNMEDKLILDLISLNRLINSFHDTVFVLPKNVMEQLTAVKSENDDQMKKIEAEMEDVGGQLDELNNKIKEMYTGAEVPNPEQTSLDRMQKKLDDLKSSENDLRNVLKDISEGISNLEELQTIDNYEQMKEDIEIIDEGNIKKQVIQGEISGSDLMEKIYSSGNKLANFVDNSNISFEDTEDPFINELKQLLTSLKKKLAEKDSVNGKGVQLDNSVDELFKEFELTQKTDTLPLEISVGKIKDVFDPLVVMDGNSSKNSIFTGERPDSEAMFNGSYESAFKAWAKSAPYQLGLIVQNLHHPQNISMKDFQESFHDKVNFLWETVNDAIQDSSVKDLNDALTIFNKNINTFKVKIFKLIDKDGNDYYRINTNSNLYKALRNIEKTKKGDEKKKEMSRVFISMLKNQKMENLLVGKDEPEQDTQVDDTYDKWWTDTVKKHVNNNSKTEKASEFVETELKTDSFDEGINVIIYQMYKKINPEDTVALEDATEKQDEETVEQEEDDAEPEEMEGGSTAVPEDESKDDDESNDDDESKNDDETKQEEDESKNDDETKQEEDETEEEEDGKTKEDVGKDKGKIDDKSWKKEKAQISRSINIWITRAMVGHRHEMNEKKEKRFPGNRTILLKNTSSIEKYDESGHVYEYPLYITGTNGYNSGWVYFNKFDGLRFKQSINKIFETELNINSPTETDTENMNFLTDVTGIVGILDTYKRMIEQYNNVSKLNIEHKEEILQQKLSQSDNAISALAGVSNRIISPPSVSEEKVGGSGLAKKTQNRRIHKFGGKKTLNKLVKKKAKKRNKKKKKQTNKK